MGKQPSTKGSLNDKNPNSPRKSSTSSPREPSPQAPLENKKKSFEEIKEKIQQEWEENQQKKESKPSNITKRGKSSSGTSNQCTMNEDPKSSNCSLGESSIAGESKWSCTNLFIVVLFFIIIALLIIVFMIIAFYSVLFSSNGELKLWQQITDEQIVNELDKLSKQFPSQQPDVWTSYFAVIESINKEEPQQPGVLLLIGRSDEVSDRTVNCLALELANTVNRFRNQSVADLLVSVKKVKEQVGPNHVALRKETDERIKTVLAESISVVVSRIEELSGESALVLHGHCDNFKAPKKRRVIILTATLDDVSADIGDVSFQVDASLRRLWDPQMGADKAASIVSRVANNPVLIEPEASSRACF